MAREIRFITSFLSFLLISLFTANNAWAQVNPLISNVTAEDKLFVEYTATIFVEPLDGDGDFIAVDPDDLSVDFDGSPSGRVTLTDFEPVAIRGQIVGYAAELSTDEDQTISGSVELTGQRFSMGEFETKFQEIGSLSAVSTVSDNAVADGEDGIEILVTLLDDQRLPIEGIQEEDFEFDFKAAGPPQIESIQENDDSNGTYTVTVSNTESGSGSYELRIAGRFVGSASFTFEPPALPTDPGNSIVTATSPHDADGEDLATISVTLIDSDGSQLFEIPIEDITVSLSGNAEIVGDAFDGEYLFQAVNNTAETVTVTVTVDDPIEGIVTLDDQPEIVFEGIDPVELVDQTRTIVEATSPHRPDGQDASTITVSLFDADNEPVDGVPENEIWLSYITGGSDFLNFSGFSSTGDTGVFEGQLTNSMVATVEVAARINGEDSYDTATIVFQSDPVSASQSEVTATSPHAADGEDASTVTIKLFDDSGNPRMITSGMTFDFEISGDARMAGKIRADESGSTQTGSLVGPPDSNETEIEIVNETEETVTVAIRVFDPNIEEWIELDDVPEIEFITMPDPELSNILRVSGTAIADGSDEIAIVVQLLDSSGQPINTASSDEFEIDISGNARSSAVEIFDDNEGLYLFSLRNTIAETVGVTVVARNVTIDRTEVEFEEEPEPEDPVVDASASSVEATSPHVADGSDASTVTVTVIGDDGEPMTGFSNSDFDIDLSGNAEASNVSHEGGGEYEFSVTNNTAQTVTVTVSVDGTELDDTPQIVFEAEEEPDPVVDASASNVEATSPHVADGSDASTVTVTVIGDDGEPMTGFSNSDFDINLSGNAEASNVSHEGGGEYEFSVTNNTAQTVTVTVSVDGTELDDTPQIVFEAEEEPEPEDPVVDASASSVSATSPHVADGSDASTVTVTVIGDDGDPMTGFSNSDFNIGLSGNAEASNVSHEGGGEYEFTVTNSTAQTVTVTVSVDGTELDDTPQIVFEAEEEPEPEDPVVDASASSVEATSPHVADGSDASTVTINLVDESGNAMDDISTGSFSIGLSGSAELASDLSNEGGGEYEVQVTNNTAETVTVTVTVQGRELDETAQIVFEEVETVVPDPPVITDVITLDEGVRIEWESSSNNVDVFQVYRGTSPNDIELLTEIPGSSSSFTDSDIPGESNFYVVTALNAAGEESASSDAVNFFDGLILSNDSWQMVSKPLNGTVQLGSSITAFSFSDRYEIAESLNVADGYWMKSNDDSSIEIEIRGEGVLETSVTLDEGWNLIGGIAYNLPVSAIGDPSGILTEAPVYHFEAGEYSEADELEPGKGYWIYAEETGTIELSLHDALASASPDLFSANQMIDGEHEQLPALTVESADGYSQQIYLSSEVMSQSERYRYLLPPKAPKIFLDVRSASGYNILQSTGDSFTIEASEYPVTIRLDDQHGSEEYQLILRDGNREEVVMIDGFRSYDLNLPVDEILIQKVSETAESITEHKLLPNYPNPFNPSTTIQYQLGENTHVTLEVFDASGRRVQVLANENQLAGQYTTSFDANNLASGMYVVRLRAGNHVQMQKISLIK